MSTETQKTKAKDPKRREGYIRIRMHESTWNPFSFYRGSRYDSDSAIEWDDLSRLCLNEDNFFIMNFLMFGLSYNRPILVGSDSEPLGLDADMLAKKRWVITGGDISAANTLSQVDVKDKAGKYYDIIRERIKRLKQQSPIAGWELELEGRFFHGDYDVEYSHCTSFSGSQIDCYVTPDAFQDLYELSSDSFLRHTYVWSGDLIISMKDLPPQEAEKLVL